MKKNIFLICLVCAFLFFSACGSTDAPYTQETEPSADNTTTTSSTSSHETNLIFSYHMELQLDATDDDWDFLASLPSAYFFHLYQDEADQLSFRAQDLPKMVYRVCAPSSTTTACDAYSEKTAGMDLDIVIDACGRFVPDNLCGESDDTEFSGQLYEDGTVEFYDISIRIRTFMVTEELDGYSASDTAEGLLSMNRLVIDLTTESVTSGNLESSGSPLALTNLVLVAAGTVSSASDLFPGADFLATLTGTLINK